MFRASIKVGESHPYERVLYGVLCNILIFLTCPSRFSTMCLIKDTSREEQQWQTVSGNNLETIVSSACLGKEALLKFTLASTSILIRPRPLKSCTRVSMMMT